MRAQKKSKNLEGDALGRSCGGMSTKIHTITDALGNPTGFYLTGGQVHDLKGADVLLPKVKAKIIIADKAYLSEERVVYPLLKKNQRVIIPQKSNAKNRIPYDKELYKARHLIEHFFAKLKRYRAIATRYDKTASCFLGAIYLVSSIILLN